MYNQEKFGCLERFESETETKIFWGSNMKLYVFVDSSSLGDRKFGLYSQVTAV